MRFRQSTAVHREVLAVDKHQTAVDHAVASHHTITWNFLVGHAEVGAPVFDKHVPLFESAFVEQDLDTLTRGEFAFGMLRIDTLLPTAQAGSRALFF